MAVKHSEQDASPGTRQCLTPQSDWSEKWQPSRVRLEEMQRERKTHRQEGARLKQLVLNAMNSTPSNSSHRSGDSVIDSSISSSYNSGHISSRASIQSEASAGVRNNPSRDAYGRICYGAHQGAP
eukprot:5099459-Pyramimonas_sp.AAC.1